MTSDQKPRVDEEDDLDDLDDVLDQFSSPPTSPQQPTLASSSQSQQQQQQGATSDDLAADFTAELEQEMESLFKGPGLDPQSTSASSLDAEESFQSRIRSTMSKLKKSESGLNPSDPPPVDGERLQGVLEGMMGLIGKEVLYEPLKELYNKFPGYLSERSGVISPEDKKRFEAQILCIKQLLDVFEAEDYRNEDSTARGKIVELMSELADYGSPLDEIMGADPNVPENCIIS